MKLMAHLAAALRLLRDWIPLTEGTALATFAVWTCTSVATAMAVWTACKVVSICVLALLASFSKADISTASGIRAAQEGITESVCACLGRGLLSTLGVLGHGIPLTEGSNLAALAVWTCTSVATAMAVWTACEIVSICILTFLASFSKADISTTSGITAAQERIPIPVCACLGR